MIINENFEILIIKQIRGSNDNNVMWYIYKKQNK